MRKVGRTLIAAGSFLPRHCQKGNLGITINYDCEFCELDYITRHVAVSDQFINRVVILLQCDSTISKKLLKPLGWQIFQLPYANIMFFLEFNQPVWYTRAYTKVLRYFLSKTQSKQVDYLRKAAFLTWSDDIIWPKQD